LVIDAFEFVVMFSFHWMEEGDPKGSKEYFAAV